MLTRYPPNLAQSSTIQTAPHTHTKPVVPAVGKKSLGEHLASPVL